MTTQTINKYANNSLLSQACYSNLFDNINDKNYYNDNKSALMDESGAKFTSRQAEEFLSKYEISYHYPNDETGLSFTVFKEKATGKLTLACRGTEMETDFIKDAAIADTDLALFSNFATYQGVNLYNATIN
ncbi:MAG: hypothetical protein BWY78_00317 [Alphaproteobacteria bacterium ADurb.Bin438]|nr:MAG: hypothetical protein BWY78_00317 [Alphaproteobacteria bacterium ADurb.Bin438]